MEVTTASKKIIIFTQFSEISEAYSLNRVVQDQIKMLLRNGYKPAALKHNFASRRVAKDVNARWLHWIHSATSPVTLGALRPHFSDEYLNLVQQPFPNAYYI